MIAGLCGWPLTGRPVPGPGPGAPRRIMPGSPDVERGGNENFVLHGSAAENMVANFDVSQG